MYGGGSRGIHEYWGAGVWFLCGFKYRGSGVCGFGIFGLGSGFLGDTRYLCRYMYMYIYIYIYIDANIYIYMYICIRITRLPGECTTNLYAPFDLFTSFNGLLGPTCGGFIGVGVAGHRIGQTPTVQAPRCVLLGNTQILIESDEEVCVSPQR